MYNFLQCVKKIEKLEYGVLKEMIICVLPGKPQNFLVTIIWHLIYIGLFDKLYVMVKLVWWELVLKLYQLYTKHFKLLNCQTLTDQLCHTWNKGAWFLVVILSKFQIEH